LLLLWVVVIVVIVIDVTVVWSICGFLARFRTSYNHVEALKGLCHEIFDLWFFHQTTPPGTLIQGLKPFWIFVFTEKFDFEIADIVVRGVNDTNWPLVGGVNDTSDYWWAVSMAMLANGGRCQWHRWPLVGGVNDTADQWWAVSRINIDTTDHMDPTCLRQLFSLKGISIKKKSYIGKLYNTMSTTFAKKF
jgi:hypothetical protein